MGRNLVTPQITSSALCKPGFLSAEDPASVALLLQPQEAMRPHLSSSCLARDPSAYWPLSFLQLFCDSVLSLYPSIPLQLPVSGRKPNQAGGKPP